jgi:GxxExxY protein
LLVHEKITRAILSGAYRVHSKLGPGLLEKPYSVCLCRELTKQRVRFETEKVLPLLYDEVPLDLGYRVDLLVENEVIVEIKSVEAILPLHEAQLLSYMKLSKKRVGLLINFNVEHRRQGIRRKIFG